MFANTNYRRFAHLFTLFYLLISPLLTVGLPIRRQEHASGSDLIAGEAFLNILMGATDLRHVDETARMGGIDGTDGINTAVGLDETDGTFGLNTPRSSRSSKVTFEPSENKEVPKTEEDLKTKNGLQTKEDLKIKDSLQIKDVQIKNLKIKDLKLSKSKDLKLYTQPSDSDIDTTPSIQIRNELDRDNIHSEGTIIAVRVSSSIGHSMINKHIYTNKEKNEEIGAIGELGDVGEDGELADVAEVEKVGEAQEVQDVKVVEDTEEKSDTVELPATTISNRLVDDLIKETVEGDQEAIASEDAPSIVAESNKSDFHVDEMEPISRDYDSPLPNNPPANLPASPIPFESKSYPGTVIYHNDGNNNARSVSYSTVIQALPTIPKWQSNEGPRVNKTEDPKSVPTIGSRNTDQNNHQVGSSVETKNYYVTSKYEEPSRYYSPEPTERNWGIPEQNYHEPSKPYTPIVYGQPEQNYEVDEAVSVETNGRAHGIQPVNPINGNHNLQTHGLQPHGPGQGTLGSHGTDQSLDTHGPHGPHGTQGTHGPHGTQGTQGTQIPQGKVLPGKKDDNQKVGYVVEGRNYRKYRVEERTSDGFIVGEYGVVRHDDGSLRGVRYTADGTISPRLIYDALMKFLSL